ncbi:MAG: sensor histidine kinase [Candidatus Dormibacteraeota bacterium]|nr:sensor histidine kinase [Candidatus Dormibacteraeota bacterium]
MPRRFGLQARLTVSYLTVALAAVVVVEAIAIVKVLPDLVGTQDLAARVQVTALQVAQQVSESNESLDPTVLRLPSTFSVGIVDPTYKPPAVRYSDRGIQIPVVKGAADLATPAAVVVGADGKILASSWPSHFPTGADAAGLLPAHAFSPQIQQSTQIDSGHLIWSSVQLYPPKQLLPEVIQKGRNLPTLGWVYVQAPDLVPGGFEGTILIPSLVSGVLLVGISLPIAVLFGFLTSRRTVRRLERLALAGAQVADGDLGQRVPLGPADEVGRLERQFNLMAERLGEARAAERVRVEEQTREAERSRIAGELHDAVSQDLFSLAMMAGGLEKALPEDGGLQARARSMRQAAEGATEEMNALLLELRPSVLERQGLGAALRELADAYRSRLGVDVQASIDEVHLSPQGEHAVLRVAQEGLSNAVRHAEARRIDLRLRQNDGRAELTVKDNGRGFDAAAGGRHGFGLRLMRERVVELGGRLTVESAPDRGTRVLVSLPSA